MIKKKFSSPDFEIELLNELYDRQCRANNIIVFNLLEPKKPKNMKEEGEIKHYWKLRNEICIEGGLVYYGIKLVILKVLRKYILTKLHETHMGISKTRTRARQLFYYPNINA